MVYPFMESINIWCSILWMVPTYDGQTVLTKPMDTIFSSDAYRKFGKEIIWTLERRFAIVKNGILRVACNSNLNLG